VRLGMDNPSPTTQRERSQYCLLKYYNIHMSMKHPELHYGRVYQLGNIPTHIALVSSICEPSICFKEVRCDALMEECDHWAIVPF
jgi:hypothetical protein